MSFSKCSGKVRNMIIQKQTDIPANWYRVTDFRNAMEGGEESKFEGESIAPALRLAILNLFESA